MQFTLETAPNLKLLTNYGEGFIEVDGKPYNSGILLFGNTVISEWKSTDTKKLSEESIKPILREGAEILILGTGSKLVFPGARFITSLQKQGVVVESMSTSAACRTYNILASEGRRVAAALMLIKP